MYLFNVTSYLTVLLALIAITGDYMVLHSKLHIFQAIFDNATHSIIGGLSWFIFCLKYKNFNSFQSLLEIAACSLISSTIDLDHFIAAKSLHLKDATNLKSRAPLHCSTFPLATCSLILVTSYILQLSSLKRCGLILLTAFASHHIRDATRRGLWFYPYGSTQPISYGVYVGLTCVIPQVMNFVKSIGGKYAKDFITRVLKMFLLMAELCSWTGRKNNFPLGHLQIMRIIFGVIKNKCTAKEYELHFAEWFRHAKQRLQRELKAQKLNIELE